MKKKNMNLLREGSSWFTSGIGIYLVSGSGVTVFSLFILAVGIAGIAAAFVNKDSSKKTVQ
ncbi:hypothetical protein [Domibacillus indicus]|uniref:hypothetical protein n=1 Tax=Domibacillus indicus TaxID=1437523 RepID=UPI000617BBF8|nr:hypothetical protein [Domibacillus indicus]